MDSIVHEAVEEICSQLAKGIYVADLWPKLASALSSAGLHHPCDAAVKQAVWSNLLNIPGLQLQAKNVSFDPTDSKIKSVEDCEKLNLKIVAGQQLRACFVGITDAKASDAKFSEDQRFVLERLVAPDVRRTGLTQDQLAKEKGKRGNNFFYTVKILETRGLIVRRQAILRKNNAPTNTNLIHLYRYAPDLGSQQRFEITLDRKNLEEGADTVEGVSEPIGKDDVLVKDFLPQLKAVCDRLGQADGKVLVVSDLKKELGYQLRRGHRAWRNIRDKLVKAGVVEEFDAKLESIIDTTKSPEKISRERSKPVRCIRLLKEFSVKLFEPRTEEEDIVSESADQRRGRYPDQLVELPIEQQIFDMIDAEGPNGIVFPEVCKRLGVSNKKIHRRIEDMLRRSGLHALSDMHKRARTLRCWTTRNFHHGYLNTLPSTENVSGKYGSSTHIADPSGGEKSVHIAPDMNFSTLKNGPAYSINTEKGGAELESSVENRVSCQMLFCPSSPQHIPSDTAPDARLCLVSIESTGDMVKISSDALMKPMDCQPHQKYPSLTNAQRERKILERLKVEKIVLKSELQRWLEKGQQTMMDRKTLKRCLHNLEKEGHCKFISFNVPGVTNYGRHRPVDVVLHSSVEAPLGDLSGQVSEMHRAFEMQIRGQGSSRFKEDLSLPTLKGIQRFSNTSNSDLQCIKSEAMRANGYVLARMVRVRLLHSFLWSYVNKLTSCSDPLSWEEDLLESKNPHSTCKLFLLDAAVKAIPLELFLQVVGSDHKFEDMIEKCKSGLILSDLPEEEYKCLMDPLATGRLSWLIDILRRLKLIRLVPVEILEDEVKIPQTTLAYALELKPYIEEPAFIDPEPLDSGSVDFRPHFRHDFVLSTHEAVEKYWQTLEYCYAAVKPNAALHAFPGSCVYEVFRSRSWATLRVMTADQRAELSKRILKDIPHKKLTFKECREIAKDLNLTLEQVLRVYYDQRQRYLRDENSPKKRKISAEQKSSKRLIIKKTSEGVQLPGLSEQDPCLCGNPPALPSLEQTRQGKFTWTEDADRKLIVLYARQRAVQGARPGTDWRSITDLPAPAKNCSKRMSTLQKDIKFRKSLMRLCNLLSQRYSQQLDDAPKTNLSDGIECASHSGFPIERWDDFNDSEIRKALDVVFMHKHMPKQDPAKSTDSISMGMHKTSSLSEKDCVTKHIDSSQRSNAHQLPKFIKHLKEGINAAQKVHESLAVSNAVELFKLVFLSTSTSAETSTMLAETLRCYSEHDLFSAFNYIREKKFMAGSSGNHPFVLSQYFLQCLALSPFPRNTGRRVSKFSCWIHDREKELMEGVVDLTSDLQCGETLHLFALISSGELSISPLMPNEGIGEAEDSRSLKRKLDENENCTGDTSKKHKSLPMHDSEICSRREKGFPGITISLTRAAITGCNVFDFFKDVDHSPLLFIESDQFYSSLGQKNNCSSSSIDSTKEAPDFGTVTPVSVGSCESPWEIMANYVEQLFAGCNEDQQTRISPEIFYTVYTAIQKNGDQGLSILEVSKVVEKLGIVAAEPIIDVLQVFGQVIKVNSYNCIHVVDSLYRSKYFLSSKAGFLQSSESSQRMKNNRIMAERHGNRENRADIKKGISMNVDDVHKITILNLSEEACQQSDETQRSRVLAQENLFSECQKGELSSDVACNDMKAILPWINGDGTINKIVYKGLTRRILGIVMQNPGILEDNILNQMEVLNPQSCRKLLELMVLDNHIIVRKIHQMTSSGPPTLLKGLLGSNVKTPKFVCREHYFANPMSTSLL